MKKFLEVLLVVLGILLIVALDWGVTIGVVYLAAFCFGLDATLLIATGIWIVEKYLQVVFKATPKLGKKGEV